MRLPLGSTSLSASGGVVTLVGRTDSDWTPVGRPGVSLATSLATLAPQRQDGAHRPEDLAEAVPSDAPDAPRFVEGQTILWRYGRFVETARVVRDDEDALIVWIPSGSARLEAVSADGRRSRDVPLDERFQVPWVVRESTWTGPGVVRVAPTGAPWSVWFFRTADGTPSGAYVNLELPHWRSSDEVFSRDLVLDLWIDAEHAGSEDVWLKDADELAALVEQGRFTHAEADAVRALADHAADAFISGARWPLDGGWDRWTPDSDMDEPLRLPTTASVQAARARRGRGLMEH
ncbi:hypothetical protein JOD62_000018 [Microbacterium keratanolyticum]|uniref:DUF402 domain-containing protein n=1 Tax=Microbacterium keratanolyticum TaxID=67574 RepID=A0A9W6HTP1_9MICO|nr:DUF402 domain-containing protein [Microbacterium keratanolyticum]MBM7467470.1 hypothetical protein [Microbacterium keratanolyticum]GLK02459.1 hypothetical protein GCM10017596_21740 [Microbacterium keratanolyticum]